MTLVWIFCSLCTRLGIEATPVGFPRTVLAVVSGWSEPAVERESEAKEESFYYDVYRKCVSFFP